jgi:hypothetical protein
MELRRLHKSWTELKQRVTSKRQVPTEMEFFQIDFAYRLALVMAESAQIQGRAYDSLLLEATTLQCEHEFSRLSKRFLRKDLFNGTAFLFDVFSPEHRCYLMYLIHKMLGEFYSRNRRSMAYGQTMGATTPEVLDSRAWGTYRVELDVDI